MDHFDADHVLKFDVRAKGEESLMMDMKYYNKEIKIMYFVSHPDPEVDPILSVFIEDPNHHLVYTRLKKSMGHFTIKTKLKGEHKIVFSNLRSYDFKIVTLAYYNQEEDETDQELINMEFDDFKREMLVQKDQEGR